MGQFTDAGSIQTNWHRICTKDLNVLGSWGFTANDLPLGVDMLDRARDRYPWLEMQTLYPFDEDGIARAVADAMAMRTVKSTIVPWPELVAGEGTIVGPAMLTGQLALTAAALFTGAAVYISLAEHPARLTLEGGALLAQFRMSYPRGFAMQASLAALGGLLGLAAWWQTSAFAWLAGSLFLLANWPFTLVAMMPINRRAMAQPEAAGSHELLRRWGRLHAARSGLGVAATLAFLVAASRP